MKFSKRPTDIYDLPLPKNTVILRPESVIVRFPNGKSSDFGALCYLRREANPEHFNRPRKQSEGRLVDLSSFTAERAQHVLALINLISEELRHSGKRTETVRDYTTRFVAFMFWADENGYQNVLCSAETARPVVQAYAKHLRERVMTNAISINSAARQQNSVFSLLERFLEVENLTRGINLLYKSQAAREVTVPPSQNLQARVLGLCESLFDGLASFILENKSYPYPLAMPRHLEYDNNVLWIFPTTSWCMPSKNRTDGRTKWSYGYNYNEGRVSTMQEIQAAEGLTKNQQVIQNAINKAKRQLRIANSDKDHKQRKYLGMIAANSFILLFLAQTGMNWAQLVGLIWANEYDISATHQSFRTIKWRAGNATVSFELPASFMPRFKRYLEVRKYILSNQSCDWLFFTMGVKAKNAPEKIKNCGTNNIYQMLQRIDPDLSAVTSRQWRAAKSDWLIRNTDPSITALVLQNSEKTVLAHYAAGSETSHIEEMTDFFDKVSETVIDKDHIFDSGISHAVGYCSSYGKPYKAAEPAPVQPDCKGPDGCLFCNKFKIHADEADTRKLVSYRYCLQLTASLASSAEFILDPIFKKIEYILAEISTRDKNLVLKVTKEVEEDGELDPYWARKLEMLMELGLVI